MYAMKKIYTLLIKDIKHIGEYVLFVFVTLGAIILSGHAQHAAFNNLVLMTPPISLLIMVYWYIERHHRTEIQMFALPVSFAAVVVVKSVVLSVMSYLAFFTLYMIANGLPGNNYSGWQYLISAGAFFRELALAVFGVGVMSLNVSYRLLIAGIVYLAGGQLIYGYSPVSESVAGVFSKIIPVPEIMIQNGFTYIMAIVLLVTGVVVLNRYAEV